MKPLTYASVCSGIECMSVAAQGLPLKPIFFSEIEPYPCAVLKYHYPEVPNFGDMTKITYNKETKELTNGRTTITLPDGGIDILAGGTPCQDFSLAGLRAGAGGDDGEYGSGTRSSNSNGGDVMPSITTDQAHLGSNQMVSGGVHHHEEGAGV